MHEKKHNTKPPKIATQQKKHKETLSQNCLCEFGCLNFCKFFFHSPKLAFEVNGVIGPWVGATVGGTDGAAVGGSVGALDGGCDGKVDGTCVGDKVGGAVGIVDGALVGCTVGGFERHNLSWVALYNAVTSVCVKERLYTAANETSISQAEGVGAFWCLQLKIAR